MSRNVRSRSIGAMRSSRLGTAELTVRKTPSSGWTRMVMRLGRRAVVPALGGWDEEEEKMLALVLGLNWMMISVLDCWSAG